VSSNEKSRKRLNGMLTVDVESGQEYLWLSSHAQSEDVARYMAHLTLEMDRQGVERVEILLDNNTTHKQKMQGLYLEEVEQLGKGHGKEIKAELVFTFLPAYSPKLNLVEYAIHLLRLRCLHHRPYNMKMQEVEERIQRELQKQKLLTPQQIINILQHIEDETNVAV
jgi:transposase